MRAVAVDEQAAQLMGIDVDGGFHLHLRSVQRLLGLRCSLLALL